MKKVLILGHGDFPRGLLSAANLILGEVESCWAVGLYPGESLEGYLGKILEIVNTLPRESEVLCLIDMFGGTPANAAALITEKRKCQCLTGVNLPMLLEVLTRRERSEQEDLVSVGLKAGKEGIVDLVKSLQDSWNERSDG